MAVRVRYAPSPTGSPHVGNLRTAVFDWLAARKYGGQFIARLEDTDRDPSRYRPEYIHDIEHSLNWLGITPDEWWVSGGEHGPYVQSERLSLYRQAADTLLAQGAAYKCFCSEERLAEIRRSRQQDQSAASGYDRRCRFLSADERADFEKAGAPHTVRLAVPTEGRTEYTDLIYGAVAVENRHIDDQVLLKSNGWPTYHLAVVVDDHHMGITHAIRGEDWMSSTPKHVLLYKALGWRQPVWVHIPLTLGADRKKLSKRHGATQFVDFIKAGYLPEAMFNFLVLLGWSSGDDNREIMSVEEIIERFELKDLHRTPAVFDYDKLRWMNGEHIRRCDINRLADLCAPCLADAGLAHDPLLDEERAELLNALPLIRERMHLLPDVVEMARPFLADPVSPDPSGRAKWLSGPEALQRLTRLAEALSSASGDWNSALVEASINRVSEDLGRPRAPIIHTARIATTGSTVGPSLFEMLETLGRDRVVARLRSAMQWVQD